LLVAFPARSITSRPAGFSEHLLTHRIVAPESLSVDQVDERDVSRLASGAPRAAQCYQVLAGEADGVGNHRSSDPRGESVDENNDAHPPVGYRSDSGGVAPE
jgi:hypothetical protein